MHKRIKKRRKGAGERGRTGGRWALFLLQRHIVGRRVGEAGGVNSEPLSRPKAGFPATKYLQSLDLYFLELCLVLQVTDDCLLSADDGSVHSGLLQVLDAHLSHLQLRTHREESQN